MHTTGALFLLTVCIFKFATGGDASVYFIYGSPGATTRGITPGIYGGRFKVDDPANATDLEAVNIHDAEYDGQFWEWISPIYLSYDPISKDVLTVLSHNRKHAMARIDPCEQGESIADQSMYFFGFDDLNTGPFALYNSKVYFVAQDLDIVDYTTVFNTLTIRRLDSCFDDENTFLESDGSDDRSCSVEVAKILDRISFNLTDPPHTERRLFMIRTFPFRGHSLLTVPNGEDLHFLVQFVIPLRGREGNLTCDLFEVKEGQAAKMLHSQVIDNDWWRHRIANTAEIAFKDGLLCWTAYRFILCARWQPGQNMGKVHQVVGPGDVAEVCVMAYKFIDYKDMVTGIVIVSASEPVELLFGCWSDFKDSGGAGHVTIKNDWKDIQIKPVTDKKGAIIAATMISIDDCDMSTSGAPSVSIAIANSLLFVFQILCFLH